MAKSNSTKPARSTRKKIDEAFAEDLLKKVHSCEPILNEQDVGLIESKMQSAEFGIGRRIGLVAASKDGAWFKALSCETDHESAVAMTSGMLELRDHIARLRELTDWLEGAEVRLMLALAARDDYETLHAEATADATA